MVQITRENKRKVYSYLLEEGVIVVKREFTLSNHQDTQVPNLHVWVLLRSLKSKGVVEEVFNWRHHYFYVKSEGLKNLRDALGIVEENIVPITFKKTKKDHLGKEDEGEERQRGDRSRGQRGSRGGARGSRGGRGGRAPAEETQEAQQEQAQE